ncbi:MAG: ABC transporter permease [Solirubrobacterales bacterium]
MNGVALLWHQFRYDQKTFWREPASVFFTVVFPLIFLVMFTAFFGNQRVTLDSGQEVGFSTYYVPGIITLSVVSATTVNLAISLTRLREAGVLKRVRGTPLPVPAFVAGRVGNAIVVSILMTALVMVLGRLFYGVAVPTTTILGLLATLLVGAAAFCCLGFALTAIIPSDEAAPAITNAIVLPLYFISGVFVPKDEIPDALLTVASLFPIRHLFDGLLMAFDPGTEGLGFDLGALLVVAVWGAVGLAIAARRFRWSSGSG